VDTLRWLHEHGCAWSDRLVCVAAARGGSIDVLQYLFQQGVEVDSALLSRMLNAAGSRSKLPGTDSIYYGMFTSCS
jgi:hypothetical protein